MERRRLGCAGLVLCLLGVFLGFLATQLGVPVWVLLLGIIVAALLSRPLANWLIRARDR